MKLNVQTNNGCCKTMTTGASVLSLCWKVCAVDTQMKIYLTVYCYLEHCHWWIGPCEIVGTNIIRPKHVIQREIKFTPQNVLELIKDLTSNLILNPLMLITLLCHFISLLLTSLMILLSNFCKFSLAKLDDYFRVSFDPFWNKCHF